MELIWLLLLLAPLLSFLYFSSKPKNLPPSPPGLPIIGNLHQLGNLPHCSMQKVAQKHGPVVLLRLGQTKALVVSSPETAKQVLKTNDIVCCSRPYSHGAMKLSYNLVDIAFSPNNDSWREIRKLWVAELFSAKRAQSFSHVRDREMSRLIDTISESSNKPIQMSEKVFSLFNNIICSSAFGGSYELKGYEKFQEAMDEAMAMLGSFWAADFFPSIGWVVDVAMGLHRRLEKCFRDFDLFYERVIEEHLKESNPDRPKHDDDEYEDDLIDVLLRMSKDETAPIRLSRDRIKAILMVESPLPTGRRCHSLTAASATSLVAPAAPCYCRRVSVLGLRSASTSQPRPRAPTRISGHRRTSATAAAAIFLDYDPIAAVARALPSRITIRRAPTVAISYFRYSETVCAFVSLLLRLRRRIRIGFC